MPPPASTPDVRPDGTTAVRVTVSAGAAAATATATEPCAETGGPPVPAASPVTRALFRIGSPVSTSDWVTRYSTVVPHTMLCPTARLVCGQLTPPPTESTTASRPIVTLPSLLTS